LRLTGGSVDVETMDPRQVSYEDYVALCGCPPVMGIDAMLAHYRLSLQEWTQLATYWNGIIATNPQYMQHGLRVEQEAARIRAGGVPRPLSSALGSGGVAPAVPDAGGHAVSGAMPGAVPPAPGYAPPAPGYAPPYPQQQQQPYPQQGYPQQGYPQQSNYDHQAAQFGNDVGNAFSAFGSALGSFVSSAVGTFAVNTPVFVHWSDGQRYPATVLATNASQVQVAFPDGRQVWVPAQYVVAR
jgi:hypothetical protein